MTDIGLDTPIDDDTPLKLAEAAKRAFPDGSMTENGLRRLANRGLLAVERINNRLYVTLGAIKEMRERCRVKPKHQDCGFESPAVTARVESHTSPRILSLMQDAKSRRDSRQTKLTKLPARLPITSQKSNGAA
jgi:hypothetical protein